MALACAASLLLPVAAQAASTADAAASDTLQEVVVTAVHDHSPVQVVTDPKQPRQPIPASDAADYLKTIPGFSAIRSGGSNSDPVFRGQFGSRLPLLTNGTQLQGACPGRMDSPSSYISPETFDQLTVVKGPQTVVWGPGASAGVVRFDRLPPEFTEPGARLEASLLGGGHGRNDQTATLEVGNNQVYLRATANHSHSQDYRDGRGQRVPSAYDKWNTDVALGWTPDANTLLELSAGAGDGWARYGGRGMDGSQFRRDSWGLRAEKKHLTPWLTKLEAQVYSNKADHVMDNFTLRTPPTTGMMAGGMASSVRRTTTGGRVAATLEPGAGWQLVTGFDGQYSPHDMRKGTPADSYANKDWERNAKFANFGWFAELGWQASAQTRWVGGLRLDKAQAWRYATGYGGVSPIAADNERSKNAMPSGFVRWEQQLTQSTTVYAGLGHVQRFPDYWELISPGNSTANKGNAFTTLQPEKTTQLDVGAQWKGQGWQAWASGYLGYVRDYMLFDYMGMGSAVRNVDARTAGFELGGNYKLTPAWTAQATLATTWGDNRSDGRPLPQTPPAELRLGLDYYAQGPWTAGALWRLVAPQHRYALNQGNVVGKDMGASSGFGVLSLNASYRVNHQWKLLMGVDNLFDKAYAEHLNLVGNSGFGFPGNTRINEPGRTWWVRADMKF
ncbi:TonB-dependent copper receptor [Comamonas sp. GB3 AK4-5]|uniref:TonB-dependent copper receptor n=1 Tax=Comamonas sp. GB3 AK4-5 TaxID=3231487 RepID=UPI00351E15D2